MKALSLLLVDDQKNSAAKSAFDSIRGQTEGIPSKASDLGIYAEGDLIPQGVREFPPVKYRPT